MDNTIENMSKECYSFHGIRDFFKKPKKSHSTKLSPNHEISNHDFFPNPKSNHTYGTKQMGVKDNNGYSKHEIDHHKGCFKAILLGTSKKKQIQSKVSDDSTTRQTEKIMKKAKSFDKTPSIGRSRSINNSKGEYWTKSPSLSRRPSLNRTMSTGSNSTNSFNGRSPVKRSISSGISTNDPMRKANSMFRSGPLIMFSNSSGVLKPPAMEQQLECTLDELCHGCVKHIKVSRDVYTFNGQVIHQEEVLKVNVQPGWRTGTKITFQGTINDENKAGEFPADIILTIIEKPHPLFRRNDDDLELNIQIPLVESLTGCNLTIPLLGNRMISMAIDEMIKPGTEKVIVGQGMPSQKKADQRGDLRVKLLVEFPKTLTDEQRSEICAILSS